MKDTTKIAASFATGGGGVNFEVRVSAAFLTTFICGGPCPYLYNERIQSIRFQSKQAGKETDDLLIKTQDQDDRVHQLLCQIKHKLTVSKENQEFKETLQRAWNDFLADDFNKEADCIAFITGPTTAKNIDHVKGVFEVARHCANAEEFFSKIRTPNFISQIKQDVVLTIESLVEEFSEAKQPDDLIWKFIKRLHLLSYDFDIDYSSDENRVVELIELNKSPECTDSAKALWAQIIAFSQTCNQNAATLSRDNLADQLPDGLSKNLLKNSVIMHSNDIRRLLEHAEHHLKTIGTEIISGITLTRTAVISSAKEMLNTSQVLLVTSEAGGGKSALVKMLIKSEENNVPVFAFRVESFDRPHLQQAFVSMGVTCSLKQLSTNMGLLPNVMIFIDSVERLLEMDHQDALIQLLKLVSEDNRIRLILTCRTYAENVIVTQLLSAAKISPLIFRVPELSVHEVKAVSNKVTSLSSLNLNDTLLSVLKNPFYLSIAANSLPEGINKPDLSTETIKKALWKEAVRKPKIGKSGLPDRRESLLCDVAVMRAKTMQPFVQINVTDHEALDALVSDNIIEKTSAMLLAPAHDLFEDIGVESYIEKCYARSNGDYHKLFSDIGPEPAIRRAFRKWLVSSLCNGDTILSESCLKILRDQTVEQFWQDEVLVGILISDQSDIALESLKDGLLENKKSLFIRAVHLLRTACKKPNTKLLKQMGLNDLGIDRLGIYLTQPSGAGWQGLIKITADNLDKFSLDDSSIVLALLKDWVDAFDINGLLSQTEFEVSKICFHFYNLILANDKWRAGSEDVFTDIILKIPLANPEKVRELYERAYSLQGHGAHHLVEKALNAIDCFPLAKDFPDIIDRCLEVYAGPDKQERRGPFSNSQSSIDIEGYFGLGRALSIHEHPASAIQGPFGFLLRFHSDSALDFIIKFVNSAAATYESSRLDGEKYSISMEYNGKTRVLIASPRLWSLYRGHWPGPDLLISCLMAIEAWMLSKAEAKEDISYIIEKIYTETNSIALLGIVASVAIAHPDAFGESALPLFSDLMFLRYDQARQIQERSYTSDVRRLLGFPPAYGIEEIFYKERSKSDSLPHRQQDLENLFIRFQLSTIKEKFLDQVEKLKTNHVYSEHEGDKIAERMVFKRIDVKNWTVIERTKEGVHIGPVIDEPDLKKVVESAQKNLVSMNEWAKLNLWAHSIFKGDGNAEKYANSWVEIYDLARKLEAEPQEDATELYANKGTNVLAYVASALIRKYYDDVEEKVVLWCCDVMCSAIEAYPHIGNHIDWMQKHQGHGSRPAALTLPKLLKKFSSKDSNYKRIMAAISLAVTNPVREIKYYGVMGVKEYMSAENPEFVRRCRNILLWVSHEAGQYLGKRWKREINYQYIYLKALQSGHKKLLGNKQIPIQTIELNDMDRADLALAISINMQGEYELDDAMMLSGILRSLVADLKQAEENRKDGTRLTNDYEFHHAFYKIYAVFMFSCSDSSLSYLLQSVIEAVDESGKAVEGIIEDLIYEADRQITTERFWKIWTPLSAKVFSSLDKGWRRADLIKAILFSKTHWNKDAKKWKPIEDNREFINIAFTTVGHTQSGFYALNRLLTTVGEFLLPEAIIDLSKSFQKAERDLLEDKYIRSELETVMRNAVLSYGTKIRTSNEMRVAALILLDALINKGSSLAYQLRELLIAPSRRNVAQSG
jgi:hypothetical protein